MTREELEADCDKFRAYLEANGHRTVCMTVGFADGVQLYIGTNEMLEESLLIVVADRLGYVVKVKP